MIKLKLEAFLCFIACLCLTPFVSAQDIPSSTIFREAITRVRPALEAALGRAEMTWGSPIYIRIFKSEKKRGMIFSRTTGTNRRTSLSETDGTPLSFLNEIGIVEPLTVLTLPHHLAAMPC